MNASASGCQYSTRALRNLGCALINRHWKNFHSPHYFSATMAIGSSSTKISMSSCSLSLQWTYIMFHGKMEEVSSCIFIFSKLAKVYAGCIGHSCICTWEDCFLPEYICRLSLENPCTHRDALFRRVCPLKN
jgi:hypothetical protein